MKPAAVIAKNVDRQELERKLWTAVDMDGLPMRLVEPGEEVPPDAKYLFTLDGFVPDFRELVDRLRATRSERIPFQGGELRRAGTSEHPPTPEHVAVTIVTIDVIRSELWRSMRTVAAAAGVAFDEHNIWSAITGLDYDRIFGLRPDRITWGARRTHAQYTADKANVLYMENGLLCQRSGIFVDDGGFFSDAALFREQRWKREPTPAELLALRAHIQTCFGWEPGQGCDSNGPILLALQTPNDATMRFHFPAGNWPANTVDATLRLAAEFLPPDRPVIVRPHPHALEDWEEHLQQYLDHFRDNWEFQSPVDQPLYEYLPRCSAVVGVNSTVLTEALCLKGMRIAALGHHVFDGAGVVLECAEHPEYLGGLLTHECALPLRGAVESYLCALLRQQLSYDASPADVRNCQPVAEWLKRCTRKPAKRVPITVREAVPGAMVLCHEPYLEWLPRATASIERQAARPPRLVLLLDRCALPADLELSPRWDVLSRDFVHPAKARTVGAEHLGTDWYTCLDADDRFPPQYCAHMADAIEKADRRVGFLYPDVRPCHADGTPERRVKEQPEYDYWRLRHDRYVSSSSAWRNVGIGWPELPNEDWALALEYTRRGWTGQRVSDARVHYRIHDDSRARAANADGSCFQSVWQGQTFGILTLLAGRDEVWNCWADWILSEDLPARTALHVLDNSGNPTYGRRLRRFLARRDVTQRFAEGIRLVTHGTALEHDMEHYSNPAVHGHVMDLLQIMLPGLLQDKAILREDDIEGFGLRELVRTLEPRSMIAAAGAVYPCPLFPDRACGSTRLDMWKSNIQIANIDTPEPLTVGYLGGGFTAWENAALRNVLPWLRTTPACKLYAWDNQASEVARAAGWQLQLLPSVRVEHHRHGVLNG